MCQPDFNDQCQKAIETKIVPWPRETTELLRQAVKNQSGNP